MYGSRTLTYPIGESLSYPTLSLGRYRRKHTLEKQSKCRWKKLEELPVEDPVLLNKTAKPTCSISLMRPLLQPLLRKSHSSCFNSRNIPHPLMTLFSLRNRALPAPSDASGYGAPAAPDPSSQFL
jgi:hypothetical protein